MKLSHLKSLVLAVMLCLPLAAGAGDKVGGGGDASEMRVNEIRADILKWIIKGGAAGLVLPSRLTLEIYVEEMLKVLGPKAVVVSFTEDKVLVDGKEKTCRGFYPPHGQKPHIICQIKRFTDPKITSESEQYRLIHHEYAGLAGVEENTGAASDYEISDQLTDYLKPMTVLRLDVKKAQHGSTDSNDQNRMRAQFWTLFNDQLLNGACLYGGTASFQYQCQHEVPKKILELSAFLKANPQFDINATEYDGAGKSPISVISEKRPGSVNREMMAMIIYDPRTDLNGGESSPLIKALTSGNEDELGMLLSQLDRINLNFKESGLGRTALTEAVRHCQRTDVVKSLLAQPQIDVNLAGANNDTPIVAAANSGCLENVKILLASGKVVYDKKSFDSVEFPPVGEEFMFNMLDRYCHNVVLLPLMYRGYLNCDDLKYQDNFQVNYLVRTREIEELKKLLTQLTGARF